MFEIFGFAVAFVLALIITFIVLFGLRFGGLDCGPMKWPWWIVGMSALSWMWVKLFELSPIVISVS